MNAWPQPETHRLSQTFLAHADRCLHSAFLYAGHGSTPSHPKARGTAFHIAAERMLRAMIERGEATFYAAGHTQGPGGEAVPEDEADAKRNVASLTEAVVNEVRAEHPDLHCTHADWDKVRLMAFHWAVANPIDPTRVVAVERKFVLDIAGATVVGKIDVATMHGQHAEVDDYKTALYVQSQEEYEAGLQRKVYALLVCFGHPVHKEKCEDCDGQGEFKGRACATCTGDGSLEVRDPCIGGHIGHVKTRELYPRYLRDDGTLAEREHTMTRTEIVDFRVDLEALIGRVQQAHTEELWPAVPGSHCHQCPAPHECPLPDALKVPMGGEEGVPFDVPVITAGNVEDEAVRWHVLSEQATALRKAIRGYAKTHETSVRIGADLVLTFAEQKRNEMNWAAYTDACAEADRLGHPRPPVDAYRRQTVSTPFEKRRVKPEEKAA